MSAQHRFEIEALQDQLSAVTKQRDIAVAALKACEKAVCNAQVGLIVDEALSQIEGEDRDV